MKRTNENIDESLVTTHTPCVICGYDLFRLHKNQTCPECGSPVYESFNRSKNECNKYTIESALGLAIFLALVHFVLTIILSGLFLGVFGLQRNKITEGYEFAFGFGITVVGLPDNLIGWTLNSLGYGLASVTFLTLIKRFKRAKSKC